MQKSNLTRYGCFNVSRLSLFPIDGFLIVRIYSLIIRVPLGAFFLRTILSLADVVGCTRSSHRRFAPPLPSFLFRITAVFSPSSLLRPLPTAAPSRSSSPRVVPRNSRCCPMALPADHSDVLRLQRVCKHTKRRAGVRGTAAKHIT